MKKPLQNKILIHGAGTGDLTHSDVEQRARENAVIRGRTDAGVSENDRAEARAEFKGERLPATTSEDSEVRLAMTRDPSEPASDRGHQVVTEESEDDETEARERLATEGVEEAQHDQMLAARDREKREDRR
ncbi:MAG: hypothetical protein WDM96_17770 [Lacunisphaera sp.]